MHLNIRKVSILGLPLVAVILGVMLMSWGFTQKAHAQSAAVVDFSITAPGCDSDGTPTSKCQLAVGSNLTVSLNLITEPVGGWAGYDAKITYSAGLNYVDAPADPDPDDKTFFSLDQNYPNCSFATGELGFSPGTASFACANASGSDVSATGVRATLAFSCKGAGQGTLTLVAGSGNTDIASSAGISFESADETLTVNCVPAPSPTPIPPTPTPPPQPKVQKLPALQNVFLTRQGDKIPPARCEDGDDIGDLNESLNIPITSNDPKDPSLFQQLGGFQFEARFDDKLVCVSITAGPAWTPNAGIGTTVPPIVCLTTSAKGLIRFGCVTAGKGADLNDSVAGCGDDDDLTPCEPLAIIHVRPQEELYSQLRPNQDNGIPVQILNQGCNLTDEQGHVIPIFSCEDADITFRYLEGDVDGPDCVVNVFDAQNIAFRWGAAKGSLLFSSFMDLSPSGQIKGEGRIDIKDLQFVFGRLGSQGTDSKGGPGVCTGDPDGSDAWPLQPPVNPKV